MVQELRRKNPENFDIPDALGKFILNYDQLRSEDEGGIDDSFEEFVISHAEGGLLDASEDLVQTYTHDVARAYSQLTPGTVVVFNYLTAKGKRSAYMVMIVGKKASGVWSSKNHTLISAFLIDESTDLNTLAIVALEKNKEEDPRKKNLSTAGLQGIFTMANFRSFTLDIGMGSMYKVNLDG